MKKCIAVLILLCLHQPIFAACAIEAGMCKAGIRGFEPLNERLLPNKLNELQDPVKLPNINTPDDIRYNLDEPQPNAGAVNNEPYNSNCQFGTCLGEPE